MLYGSWNIFCNFVIFTTISQKNKILKNWKKCQEITAQKIKIKFFKKKTPGDIMSLHKCTKNHDHILQCSWDIAHDRCNCFFSFWAIICPFNPLFPHLPPSPLLHCPQNKNFEKMKKNAWRYHHLTYVYQKLWSVDGQTGRQKK